VVDRTVDERRSFGDYEVESLLGKGSIGKVYLARHRRIGRRVALKTVRPEYRFEDDLDRSEFYKRFQREAEVCGALQHPNVVTLYEVGYEGEVVAFLASEYVDGESLQTRLRRTRPLPLAEALRVGTDVLRGLGYAHGKGVVHRDIKPANILTTSEGQTKIADFGIARPMESSMTGTNSLLGTPNYMSPEQVKSTPVTPRSDLFSTGVVLYELLTGLKPFAAPELSGILYNIVHLNPPRLTEVNSSIPAGVGAVVDRLLAKNPEERYASASDALRDLEKFLAEAPSDPPADFQTMPPVAVTSSHHEPTAPIGASVTDPNPFQEATQPTPMFGALLAAAEERPSIANRPIPPLLFWGIALPLVALLIGAVAVLQFEADHNQPAGVITAQQLADYHGKRGALNEARAAAANGKYEEAMHRYDALLARYPQNVPALTERAAAKRMLEKSAEAGSSVTVTKPARASDKPPAKPPSRWNRVKQFFRGKPASPSKKP
jgi:Serine/threonine protein kinase